MAWLGLMFSAVAKFIFVHELSIATYSRTVNNFFRSTSCLRSPVWTLITVATFSETFPVRPSGWLPVRFPVMLSGRLVPTCWRLVLYSALSSQGLEGWPGGDAMCRHPAAKYSDLYSRIIIRWSFCDHSCSNSSMNPHCPYLKSDSSAFLYSTRPYLVTTLSSSSSSTEIGTF